MEQNIRIKLFKYISVHCQSASYTKAYDETCTHDLIQTTITDIGSRDISSGDRTKWQSKTSSTQENNGNANQAVQVCGTNLVCYACTSGTTTKKCLTYTAPTNPNNAGKLVHKLFIFIQTFLEDDAFILIGIAVV